jgi:hypothetical protein
MLTGRSKSLAATSTTYADIFSRLGFGASGPRSSRDGHQLGGETHNKGEDVAGRKTVTFDGSSYFEGPESLPGIEGDGTCSIEIWVYRPGKG